MLRIPVLIVLAAWALFWVGAAFEYETTYRSRAALAAFFALAGAPLVLVKLVADRRARWWPALRRRLEEHTDAVDALPGRFDWLWVALAAGLGLYAELVLIRFHSSCSQVFAFFKNFSLLSCFLGLGLGYALGRVRPLFTPLVLPMLAVQMVFLHALRFTPVADFLHNPVSEQLALGLEQANDWYHLCTVYGFLLFVFCYNALCFVPLGQVASRLMSRGPRLPAYGWNLLGSLAGILLFYGLSFAWTPPAVWAGALVLGMLVLLRRHALVAAAAAVVLLAALSINGAGDRYDIYSPYQILTVKPIRGAPPEIRVNHVYFQQIHDLRDAAVAAETTQPAEVAEQPADDSKPAGNPGAGDEGKRAVADYYGLPYQFKPEPQDVLIVGSGSGNDVASALRRGAGRIRAVEIDPAIRHLGRLLHPESPYQAPNVNSTIDDARAFIRKTDERYDLIVYGLLDSHTLLSGMSGVRLDSYIYTVEAFREARARLKPGGVICLTFCIIRPELGLKLYLMLEEAFDGHAPVVYRTGYDGGVAFVVGDTLSPANAPPPPAGMEVITDVLATRAGGDLRADKCTDDWPFFYMPVRKYPLSYLMVIAVLLAVAGVFVYRLMPSAAAGGADAAPATKGTVFSAPCFLLGAGFMLLETKAITELALYYGSTWVVIGVVIAAILTMAFLANLLLVRLGRVNLGLAYGLLLATLALSLVVPASSLSALGPWGARIVATAILSLPLFFAGLVFSTELGRARSTGVALSSNLLGAMLGGCLEYNAMYFGYRSLAVLALLLYGAACAVSLLSLRSRGRNATTSAPRERSAPRRPKGAKVPAVPEA